MAHAIAALPDTVVYCDIEGFRNPSIITGEDTRPDLVVESKGNIFIMELTSGYETNINKNAVRKSDRYKYVIEKLRETKPVKYLNLSMGAIGIIGKVASNISKWLEEIGLRENEKNYIIRKITNVSIRTTYYIFCKRDTPWEDPKLLKW